MAGRRDLRGERYLQAAEQAESDRRQLREAARQAMGEWLGGLATWDMYFTATYDRRRVAEGHDWRTAPRPAFNERTCRRHVEKWLREGRGAIGGELQAVAVIEQHADGWPHAHGLIACGGLRGFEFRLLGPLWFGPHGYIRLEAFDAALVGAAGSYLAKYLVKADPELVLSGFDVAGGLEPLLEALRGS